MKKKIVSIIAVMVSMTMLMGCADSTTRVTHVVDPSEKSEVQDKLKTE